MYLDWEMPNLIDNSSDIEELHEERGSLQIFIYPNRFFLPANLKIIFHPIIGGMYHPRYNKQENIIFFFNENQLKEYSRTWEIHEDFLCQFITEIKSTEEREASEIDQPVLVTNYPTSIFSDPKEVTVKNIGVATKSNLGIQSPGRHLSNRGFFIDKIKLLY